MYVIKISVKGYYVIFIRQEHVVTLAVKNMTLSGSKFLCCRVTLLHYREVNSVSDVINTLSDNYTLTGIIRPTLLLVASVASGARHIKL